MEELHSICKRYSIPYKILIETPNGEIKVTKDTDRKGVVINRIKHFLKTGSVLPATCFKNSIVRLDEIPNSIKKNDRIFYGHYTKSNKKLFKLLYKLTNGKFRDGAIARILIKEFWSNSEAPTCQEFAEAWQKTKNEHKNPKPEWAYLSDRKAGKAGPNWKDKRKRKAEKVMKILEKCITNE